MADMKDFHAHPLPQTPSDPYRSYPLSGAALIGFPKQTGLGWESTHETKQKRIRAAERPPPVVFSLPGIIPISSWTPVLLSETFLSVRKIAGAITWLLAVMESHALTATPASLIVHLFFLNTLFSFVKLAKSPLEISLPFRNLYILGGICKW